MNLSRIAAVAIGAAGLGLGGCHGSTPSDTQLTQLLHSERATPTDPKAPLDAAAVNCLRAWSGDVELSASLPPSASGEAIKQACKTRLSGWFADGTRNPDKLAFDDVAKPPSVKRAMALLAEHQPLNAMAPKLPGANEPMPAAMMPNAGMQAQPSGPVDMTEAVTVVDELDGLCQKAKQQAATGDPSQPLARYASYCDKRIEQMRQRISMLQQHGNPQQAKMMTENAKRTLEVGRKLAAGGTAAPAPQNH
jgi:exonuclease VII small subunit